MSGRAQLFRNTATSLIPNLEHMSPTSDGRSVAVKATNLTEAMSFIILFFNINYDVQNQVTLDVCSI